MCSGLGTRQYVDSGNSKEASVARVEGVRQRMLREEVG